MKWIIIPIVSYLGLIGGCVDRSLENRMQRVLERGIHKYDIHGASAAIIKEEGITWIGTSGVSHDTVDMRPDMVFGIGSVSKTVIAALTLRLVEEGEIGLDDPISTWLPSITHVDDSITVRQLLGHTSGIFNLWDNENIWDDLLADRARYWTPEEVLSYLEEPQFSPGQGFHYSNINYLLVAMILEKVSGSRLVDLLHRFLWDPLELENVYLSLQEQLPDNLAHVYGDDYLYGQKDEDVTHRPRVSHESVIFGSSGVFTSAESLARFGHALFEGKILKTATLMEMLTFIEFKPFSNMNAYGLGVQRYSPYFAHREYAIGHGGANIGTTTYLIHLPDYHATIVVMINAFPSAGADFIAKGLIRIVVDKNG